MNDELMSKIRDCLVITERAQNQLPPVTSYRHSFAARSEIWLKNFIRKATHWFTWEQVNFNSATHEALKQIHAALAQMEQKQFDLEAETTQLKTRLEKLLDEQRVCFKQLSLEVSEGLIVSDRTRRSIQLQLDQLSANLARMQALVQHVETEEIAASLVRR